MRRHSSQELEKQAPARQVALGASNLTAEPLSVVQPVQLLPFVKSLYSLGHLLPEAEGIVVIPSCQLVGLCTAWVACPSVFPSDVARKIRGIGTQDYLREISWKPRHIQWGQTACGFEC